jgi:hypothetical protein
MISVLSRTTDRHRSPVYFGGQAAQGFQFQGRNVGKFAWVQVGVRRNTSVLP